MKVIAWKDARPSDLTSGTSRSSTSTTSSAEFSGSNSSGGRASLARSFAQLVGPTLLKIVFEQSIREDGIEWKYPPGSKSRSGILSEALENQLNKMRFHDSTPKTADSRKTLEENNIRRPPGALHFSLTRSPALPLLDAKLGLDSAELWFAKNSDKQVLVLASFKFVHKKEGDGKCSRADGPISSVDTLKLPL